MTDIFDKFSHLDPARAQKQIEEDIGSPIFDQFSILDGVRSEQQIEQALDHEIFTNFTQGDYDLMLYQYSFKNIDVIIARFDSTSIKFDSTTRRMDEAA